MASATIRAYTLPDSEYAEWNTLVASSPDGSIYSMPEYLDALCSAAGGQFRILGVRSADELIAGIGLYELRSAGQFYVSPRLLLYYNGLVLIRRATKYPSRATSLQIQAQTAVVDALDEVRYDVVRLQSRSSITDLRVFIERGWRVWPGYTYVVDLADGEAVWSRIEQNLRRLVKRCTGDGFGMTDDDDFDPFFRLHALTMERLGVAPYLPAREFSKFFHTLRGQGLCRLFHARLPDGQVVASQLVLLGPHAVTHTVSAAADPDHANAGVSAFLRWRSFEALMALGYRGNDLTDASLNSIAHFKSQLGGELQVNFVAESPGSMRHRLAGVARGGGDLLTRVKRRLLPGAG